MQARRDRKYEKNRLGPRSAKFPPTRQISPPTQAIFLSMRQGALLFIRINHKLWDDTEKLSPSIVRTP